MLKNQPLLRFFLLFLCIYSLFLVTNKIEPIKQIHYSFFAKVGAWVYSSWHPDYIAEITTDVESLDVGSNEYVLTSYDKKEANRIRIYNLKNPRSPQQIKSYAAMAFKARMSHSIATFFLLSLILATPNHWIRKLVGSAVAIYILYILVAMKLTFLLDMSDGSKTSDDGFWYFLSGIIGNNESYLELYYILIIAIWVLVSVSKESVSRLTSNNSGSAA